MWELPITHENEKEKGKKIQITTSNCSVKGYHFPLVYDRNSRQNFELLEEKESYKTVHTLIIKKFSKGDVGTYTCMSTNSLGMNQGTVRLYGKGSSIG